MNTCQGLGSAHCKILLPVCLWLCINVLHDIGECCESVPLDCTRSYISISINITKILARVVQVDAFIISLEVGYICVVIVVGCWFSSKFCISCVKLEYWLEYQRFTVEQCLLWTTCTGHHWLVTL